MQSSGKLLRDGHPNTSSDFLRTLLSFARCSFFSWRLIAWNEPG